MEVAAENPGTWAVGFEDECWWSRLALPTLNAWSEEGDPLRLVQRSVAKDDPSEATKAISCYGLYLPEISDMWLRFVDGKPVSSITTQFLQWGLEKLEEMGKKVLLLIWDNADKILERIGNGKPDKIIARGSHDVILANKYGNDTDVVKGGKGWDKINVRDGDPNDTAGGGKGGHDWCITDANSELTGSCERIN